MKSTIRFPKRLVQGNTKVTIYRNKHAKTSGGFIYQVAWYAADGARRLKQFTDQDEAIADGKRRLEQLAAGEVEAGCVSNSDLRELRKARELAGEVPLLAALEEWKAAREFADVHLIEAAKEWQERQGSAAMEKTFEFVYSEFLKAKRLSGNDPKTYTKHLDAFKTKYGNLKIAELKEPTLQRWLNSFENHSTRNTKRKRLVTLFRWAQKKSYLSRSIKTEAEMTDTALETESKVETIEALALFGLLDHMKQEHPHYVAPLALAGLCGLRRAEVQGQLWEDIHLERKLLKVSSAKKGTPSYRIVRLSEKALKWLSFSAQPAGEVCPGNTWAMDRIRDIGQTGDRFTLPPNCFRNGYISHLVALSGDIARTALEAGNSPAIIRKHYLELFTAEDGVEWFGDFPEATGRESKQQKTRARKAAK
jgi:integrase